MNALYLLPLMFAASAFFSSSETSLFALRRTDFLKWKEEGNRKAALLERMLETPSRLIATIFIGNEFANVAISSILASALIPLFQSNGEIVATAVGTLGILILGDLAPKCVVWPRARQFALLIARPLHAFSLLILPVRALMEGAANAILRLFGESGLSHRKAVTEREFRALVDVGGETGTLDPNETELIHNIFEMTDRRAGEIMTPLPDVFMVPSSISRDDLFAAIRRYRRSRVPVFGVDRRDIVGVLHFKELMRRESAQEGAPGDWAGGVTPPFFIPSSKKLPLLLREFQKRKVHMAVVVDEFGDAVGIVTLEDVLEELFGEIREEHEREEREIVRNADGSARVLGKTPIHRFNEEFDTALPDEEWDTVAGLVLHESGSLPGRGDSVDVSGYRFTVTRLKGIRIVELLVAHVPEEQNGAGGGERG